MHPQHYIQLRKECPNVEPERAALSLMLCFLLQHTHRTFKMFGHNFLLTMKTYEIWIKAIAILKQLQFHICNKYHMYLKYVCTVHRSLASNIATDRQLKSKHIKRAAPKKLLIEAHQVPVIFDIIMKEKQELVLKN